MVIKKLLLIVVLLCISFTINAQDILKFRIFSTAAADYSVTTKNYTWDSTRVANGLILIQPNIVKIYGKTTVFTFSIIKSVMIDDILQYTCIDESGNLCFIAKTKDDYPIRIFIKYDGNGIIVYNCKVE